MKRFRMTCEKLRDYSVQIGGAYLTILRREKVGVSVVRRLRLTLPMLQKLEEIGSLFDASDRNRTKSILAHFMGGFHG